VVARPEDKSQGRAPDGAIGKIQKEYNPEEWHKIMLCVMCPQ
jgi:hypothetical protein